MSFFRKISIITTLIAIGCIPVAAALVVVGIVNGNYPTDSPLSIILGWLFIFCISVSVIADAVDDSIEKGTISLISILNLILWFFSVAFIVGILLASNILKSNL